MAMIHSGGEEFIANLLAGKVQPPAAYKAGLGNWTPATADTYASIQGEPSGNGYARHSLSPSSLDVASFPDGDGYMVTFTCSFTASGGNFPRVKQIHFGDDTALMFSIPITEEMLDPAANLDWDASTGLLITDGDTFTPVYLLYIANRNAVAPSSGAAPKPVYNAGLDPANPLTEDIIFCSWMRPDGTGQNCTTLTDVSGNALHGTLSGLDPVAPVVVSGAGSTAYNQDYTPNSTEGGKTRYVSADGLYKIAYDDMGMNWWMCPIGVYPKMDGGAYYSNGEFPWSTTWTTYTYPSYPGTAPAPTVSQGAAAAGPWTDDGLQFNGSGYVDLGTSAILNPQVAQVPIVVSGATGGNAVVNQNYTKSGTNVWTSADTNYKIMIDWKAWPNSWTICTADYDPKGGKGTAYFHSSEDPYASVPYDDTWTGVSVAQGSANPAPGDPTGMTIHMLVKVGTSLSQEVLFSRWHRSTAAEDAYMLYRPGSSGKEILSTQGTGGTVSVTDAIAAPSGSVVSYTAVWTGSLIVLYRNGVQVTVTAAVADEYLTTVTHTGIGAVCSAISDTPFWFSTDEVRLCVVWKRGLTAAEVKSLADDPYQLAVT